MWGGKVGVRWDGWSEMGGVGQVRWGSYQVGWVACSRTGGVDEWCEVGLVGCDGMGWVEVGWEGGRVECTSDPLPILHIIVCCIRLALPSPHLVPPCHPLSSLEIYSWKNRIFIFLSMPIGSNLSKCHSKILPWRCSLQSPSRTD